MDALELVRLNLLTPAVLAFALGLVATLVRSDLRLPEEAYTALSIFLLLAIGLKGGAELAGAPLAELWRPALATLAIGVAIPLVSYAVLRRLGKLDIPDAAAIAAHYGSVSVVTFVACTSFVQAVGLTSEPIMATLVAVMEVPAIVVALLLAQTRMGKRASWPVVLHEVFAGRSIVLLVGGLGIGFLAGKPGLAQVAPFFVDPFQGVLTLFLLHMGTVAARRLRDLRHAGLFIAGYATVMPVIHGAAGVALAFIAGLSLGGATIFGAMAASASYIAAPAAVRMALPAANPGLYLTSSLGITFPFNLTIGIPLYYAMARALYGI